MRAMLGASVALAIYPCPLPFGLTSQAVGVRAPPLTPLYQRSTSVVNEKRAVMAETDASAA